MTIRASAQSLADEGMTYRQIARRLETSEDYVRTCLSVVTFRPDDSMPDEEDEIQHINAVMVEGGYPAAIVIDGVTFRVGPYGHAWRHIPKVDPDLEAWRRLGRRGE